MHFVHASSLAGKGALPWAFCLWDPLLKSTSRSPYTHRERLRALPMALTGARAVLAHAVLAWCCYFGLS